MALSTLLLCHVVFEEGEVVREWGKEELGIELSNENTVAGCKRQRRPPNPQSSESWRRQ